MNTNVTKYVANLCETITGLKEDFTNENIAALDQFTNDIKYVQELFKKHSIKGFEYSWSELVNDHFELVFSIIWDDKRNKIMYRFSEEDQDNVLLGEPLEVRLGCSKHFKSFLEKGVREYSDLLNNALN